jgi:gliding motility-associated lipoprotein GldD
MITDNDYGIQFYKSKMDAINPMIIILILSGLFFVSCKKNEYPKEYVYPRIDYPAAKYIATGNSACPYYLEYPVFSSISIPETKKSDAFWLDIRFESYKASFYTTFLKINNKTDFAEKELSFNNMLIERLSEYSEIRENKDLKNHQGYNATIYEIKGDPAMPIAFYISDKQNFFYQGYLYFDYIPVTDSISDITNGIKRDLTHMIESFRLR